MRRNGSECSPRPYRYGSAGRAVRRRRYCVSKTSAAADVSNRTSPVSRRATVKEKGDAVWSKRRRLADAADLADERAKTDSGTW